MIACGSQASRDGMFKKNITVAQTRPLSGKDSKQLRRDVQVSMRSASAFDA